MFRSFRQSPVSARVDLHLRLAQIARIYSCTTAGAKNKDCIAQLNLKSFPEQMGGSEPGIPSEHAFNEAGYGRKDSKKRAVREKADAAREGHRDTQESVFPKDFSGRLLQ